MSTGDDTPGATGNRVRLAVLVVLGLLGFGIAVGLVVSWLGTTALRAAGVDETPSVPQSPAPQSPAPQSPAPDETAPGPAATATEPTTSPPATRAPATRTPTSSPPAPREPQDRPDARPNRSSRPSSAPDRPQRPDRTDGSRRDARPRPGPGEGGLRVSRGTVGSYEPVRLRGQVAGATAGTRLRVERREGDRWARFPVTTSARARGYFTVRVALGRPGANVLRVSVIGSPRSSPPVTVEVS